MTTRYYINGYAKPIENQLRSAGAKYDPATQKWYTHSQDISISLQRELDNQTNQKNQPSSARSFQVGSEPTAVTEKLCRCGTVADIWATNPPMCSECYAKAVIRVDQAQGPIHNEVKHWANK